MSSLYLARCYACPLDLFSANDGMLNGSSRTCVGNAPSTRSTSGKSMDINACIDTARFHDLRHGVTSELINSSDWESCLMYRCINASMQSFMPERLVEAVAKNRTKSKPSCVDHLRVAEKCTPHITKKPPNHSGSLMSIGGACVTRTHDLRIKSPLLYQLS